MADGSPWRVAPNANLIWRTWGDESVVFDPRSGDTHLLDTVSREVLALLEQQALALPELCHVTASRLNLPEDADLDRYVQQLVRQFADLGLLETVSA